MYNSRYGSRGPSPLTITLIAAVMVFGGYLLWSGFMNWLDTGQTQGRIDEQTREAAFTATAEEVLNQPSVRLFPTSTPIPPCEFFYVKGPQAAFIRECPSTNCDDVGYVDPDEAVCTVGRATDPDYPHPEEWLVILLDPDAIIAEFAYMHESVLKAANPTATSTSTPEPLPTITRTPGSTPQPTATAGSYTPTPNPSVTPSPVSDGVEI